MPISRADHHFSALHTTRGSPDGSRVRPHICRSPSHYQGIAGRLTCPPSHLQEPFTLPGDRRTAHVSALTSAGAPIAGSNPSLLIPSHQTRPAQLKSDSRPSCRDPVHAGQTPLGLLHLELYGLWIANSKTLE
ncbi:hypothetical protein RRG08_019361 [Elysia crispata]|uniref:Uncharacterized protein n=1 Tax=Elysia crispata TaxID=231223 RepID=A0AAE1EA69_9GAST|nr:hypothetical protein RRG08_019361 [Elysia crispata]